MKKLALLIVLLSLISCLYAESLDKYITAYKRGSSGEVPTADVQFRIVPENDSSFELTTTNGSNGDIYVPNAARGTSTAVFSWVLSGNVFNKVNLNLTFCPMYKDGNSSNSRLDYSVTETYTTTRVGNTQISVNKDPSTVSGFANNFFSTEYVLKYADSIVMSTSTIGNSTPESAEKSVSVNSSSNQTIYLRANLSTRTVITPNGYLSNFPNNTIAVCDHWNRYGEIKVNVGLSTDGKKSDGTSAESGVYYANVIVSISCAR